MHHRLSRTLNLVLMLSLVVLCSIALVTMGRWMLSERYRDRALLPLSGWMAGTDIQLEEWERAVANMEQAIRLNERNGSLHFFLGLLHELRARAPYPAVQQLPADQQMALRLQLAAADVDRALAGYRNALLHWPTMAEAWLHLAKLKLVLGQFDQEFIGAYSSAYLHGRNVAGYQLDLTELSVGFYNEILGTAGIAPLQTQHLGTVLQEPGAARHIAVIETRGVLPQVCARMNAMGVVIAADVSTACEASRGQPAPGVLRQ